MKQIQKLYPHLLALLGFVFIALVYFYPVLQGKKIYQSDIVQYTAMAKEQSDFRKNNHQEPYWTNAAFGGMPTYQLGAKFEHDYIGALDDAIRFLPRPADYLFIYFLGFYALLLVLKIDPLKAFFGALAFGFSTYLIVILGVGHNAKAHAIAYMPLVVAGVLMVFQKRFIYGGLLTMVAVALELNANHFQMTYYLLFLLLFIGIYYAYKFIKNKEYKPLLFAAGTFVVALIVAVGVNATSLLATKEYADFSTRGKSELKLNADGTKKTSDSALSREYITEYSYGIAESFDLIAPRLFGGGNSQKLNEDSSVYNYMINYGASPEEARQFTENYGLTYWGEQPIVAAPAYIGAVVFFLFILGMFHDKRKIKYAFLAGAVFSLILSWGKNLSIVTNFFIDYVPMFDKFRAVSSIQVVLELCVPVMAILGLQAFFTTNKEKQWDTLLKAGATSIGLLVVLFFCRSMFDFAGAMDGQLLKMFSQGQDQSFGISFLEALKEDRRSLYAADLLRSGFFIAAVFAILYFYSKNKLAETTAIVMIGLFMVGDLFFVDKNYVSSKDFVSAREVDMPFQATPADEQIMQDTTNYRVLEVDGNLSSARASYFHKSIGGYSAVKPRRMQELFDYQIAKNNMNVLDMLNVKYLIQTNEKGAPMPIRNPEANGNAWFVKEVKFVQTPDEEIKALKGLDTKNLVIINQKEFGSDFKNGKSFAKDSLATIQLQSYQPNRLVYATNNAHDGLAVFSEIYYKNGWIATVDGKETPVLRGDYTLRVIAIPAGKHTVVFKFEPKVIKTGGVIALISTLVMLLLIIAGVYFERKSNTGKS